LLPFCAMGGIKRKRTKTEASTEMAAPVIVTNITVTVLQVPMLPARRVEGWWLCLSHVT
jgi:hypothetical protein